MGDRWLRGKIIVKTFMKRIIDWYCGLVDDLAYVGIEYFYYKILPYIEDDWK